MSYAIEWHAAAEAELLRVPHWKTAAASDGGLIRFAETGVGAVERVANHPNRYRLRVVGYDAVFMLDAASRTLTVIGVYRVR